MYDRLNNEITFPHIIPTATLGGKTHTWNDVDGGATRVADLFIDPNKFFGGNVLVLGMVKAYGMYACQSKNTSEIIGFYVHDPETLTKLGKKLIKEAFPNKTVKFELYRTRETSPEEIKELQRLRQYYKENGMSPSIVDKANAEELESLWKALQSGKAEKQIGSFQDIKEEPVLEKDVVHEHDGSNVSPKILENKKPAQKKFVR